MFGKRKPTEQEVRDSPFLVAWRNEDGGMTVKLDAGRIGSTGAAGIITADIVRHFARALTQYGAAGSEAQAVEEIMQMFSAEMEAPTDVGSGSIVN